MSDKTKNMKFKYILFKTISVSLTIVPLIIYILLGLINGNIHVGQKLFLSFTCIMALILTILNTLLKYKLRSPLFLLLLGIYYALTNILPLLIIISMGIIFDEFVFSPLAKKYKEKYTINKEIDERL